MTAPAPPRTPGTVRMRALERRQRVVDAVYVGLGIVTLGLFVGGDELWRSGWGVGVQVAVASAVFACALVLRRPAVLYLVVFTAPVRILAQDLALDASRPATLGGACATALEVDPATRLWACKGGRTRDRSCMRAFDEHGYALLHDARLRLTSRLWGPLDDAWTGPLPGDEAGLRAVAAGGQRAEDPVEALRSLGLGGRRPRGVTLDVRTFARDGLALSWDEGRVVEVLHRPRGLQTFEVAVVGSASLAGADDHALWLRRTWLHEPTTEAQVAALLDELEGHGIRTAYPFAGPLGPGGRFGWRDGDRLRELDLAAASAFFGRVHGTSRTRVLPWTGGVLGRDAFPDDPAWRARFVAAAVELVQAGADGIHVNIEPMPESTAGYLPLLRELRAAIAPASVSVAAYPPPTPLHPFVDLHWSTPFLADVCAVADDVAVMAYDTAQGTPEAYRALMATWTAELDAVAASQGCTLRVGLPAYEDDAPWHRPDAETLAVAIDGVADATPHYLAGAALYAHWTLDPAEWSTFDRRWRER